MWPRLRTALNTERAAELGTQIAEGKKTALTRPHPHTLHLPSALKTAGPPCPGAGDVLEHDRGQPRLVSEGRPDA
jgi:hypothetical protein